MRPGYIIRVSFFFLCAIFTTYSIIFLFNILGSIRRCVYNVFFPFLPSCNFKYVFRVSFFQILFFWSLMTNLIKKITTQRFESFFSILLSVLANFFFKKFISFINWCNFHISFKQPSLKSIL
jgi:hypothetical protein